MRDLLVIGGGPAGLSSALYAARAGLDVQVWDKQAGAIDKACGEGLMPGAVTALESLSVKPEGQDLAGIRYLAGGHSIEAPFRAGVGRGVRRTTLHTALREAALDAGVELWQRHASSVVPSVDSVLVGGERFRYVVAADGLHSPVRRMLGLEGPSATYRRYGLRRHFGVAPWTSFVEVHWSADAEAYVTPVAPDLVCVAILTAKRGSFDERLAAFPELLDRLRGCDPSGQVMGAGPLRQRALSPVAGRVLLVGDAGGYVDALTGEGVSLALAQASAAVGAIVDGAPNRYTHDWQTVTRRYRLLTSSLLIATRHRHLRSALVPTAERLPRLFSAVVNALARPA